MAARNAHFKHLEIAKRRRHPMVPIALAFCAGILMDRGWAFPLDAWLLLGLGFAAAWFAADRFGFAREAALLCFALTLCAGGARHHAFWSTRAADDISLFATDEPRPIRLIGTLCEQPEIIPRPSRRQRGAWSHPDLTVASLRCRQIVCGDTVLSVSGRAALRVSGQLRHVDVGDEIEVCGRLMRSQPARNPGGYDAAQTARRQGALCLIVADPAEGVVRRSGGPLVSIARSAAHLRAEGQSLLYRDLSRRTAPVAAALLFGIRAPMDEEIRDAFTQSGMLHVLAISGMHVAILAVLLVAVARAFGLSHRMTSLWVIVATVAYTLLTDCRPPVMRATTLVCLFCLAKLFYRRPAYFNAMAIAVVALLLWNPSDLFDVGAQLSFLAVLGVLWGARLMRPIAAAPTVYDLLGNATQAGWMRESGGRVWGVVKEGYLISLAVFFFSAPLIAARFHLVSPIGVVINVVLAPLSTLVLWCGYVHLAVGLLLPWISAAPAWFFDLGLRALLVLVEASARIRMSHAYVPGPPDWWLAGYYGILFAAAFVPPLCRAGCRKWSILTGWAVAGLACGLYWPAPNGLRCTFLSVGHGGAILIETPSGRTLLYDAGALNDSRIAQRAVQEVLWNHGYGKIDSILASHADIDHFNAIAGLIQTLPVGSLLVSQQFLDFRQPAVVSVCDAAAERDVPIQLIHDGDRLSLDARVAITVLHPPPGRPHADDNANSAVVLIEFAGRRILLTGDLDGSGQAALLSQPPHDVDVLLAPHHGSAKANPPALAQWAHPEHVVVSAGPRLDLQRLAAVYGPDAEVLSTYRAGAITFEITPEGNLHRSTIRPVAPTHHRMGSTTFAIQ